MGERLQSVRETVRLETLAEVSAWLRDGAAKTATHPDALKDGSVACAVRLVQLTMADAVDAGDVPMGDVSLVDERPSSVNAFGVDSMRTIIRRTSLSDLLRLAAGHLDELGGDDILIAELEERAAEVARG